MQTSEIGKHLREDKVQASKKEKNSNNNECNDSLNDLKEKVKNLLEVIVLNL